MMQRFQRLSLAALSAVTLGGCVIHTGPGAGGPQNGGATNQPLSADPQDPPPAAPPEAQPPPNPPPAARTPPATVAANVASGRPGRLRGGRAAGYWIWHAGNGVWKLRTTTATRRRVFRGRIRGPIGRVRANRNEFRDRVRRGNRGAVVFNFATKGHMDGLDFRARRRKCLTFNLQLDGRPIPANRIFLGRGQANPASNHFRICPR